VFVGRDSEGEILDPTATIVGTAHPNERASLFDKFFEIAQAGFYFGETYKLKVFAAHNSRLPVLRLRKNKSNGHFFSSLRFLFSHGAATYNLMADKSCFMPGLYRGMSFATYFAQDVSKFGLLSSKCAQVRSSFARTFLAFPACR
jgi:hypothetical protein